MYVTVVVAEELKSRIKAFLIAPKFSKIKSGDTVKASNMDFRVLFVDDFHQEDDVTYTALTVALGAPERITAVMEAVRWEEEE